MCFDPSDPDALRAIENAFRAAAIPPAGWTHAAHLAVAGQYLVRLPVESALDELRAGIRRLNHTHGLQTTLQRGYHETLTRFWVYVADGYLRRNGPASVAAMVSTYAGQAGLWRDYYSQEIVRLPEARFAWLPPDRQPLGNAKGPVEELVSVSGSGGNCAATFAKAAEVLRSSAGYCRVSLHALHDSGHSTLLAEAAVASPRTPLTEFSLPVVFESGLMAGRITLASEHADAFPSGIERFLEKCAVAISRLYPTPSPCVT